VKTEMIVVAAGRGSRMGTEMKKQYLPLLGVPLLVRTLQVLAACPHVERIVVVSSPEDVEYVWELVHAHGVEKVGDVVPGGAERQDSVRLGLAALLPETHYVAVHDAARPLVTSEEVAKVLAAARSIGAATLGVRVKDTVKRVRHGLVEETIPREELWAVHTPQAFRRDWLEEAHQRTTEQQGLLGTDDASLVEWIGYRVAMVEGSYENLKITTPDDLVLAETLWQRRLPESRRGV